MYLQAIMLIAKKVRAQGSISLVFYIIRKNWGQTLSQIVCYVQVTPEEKTKRPQLCHMPFGFGPCICIGMRLALLEAKITLIELLKRYTFIRAPETEVCNVM